MSEVPWTASRRCALACHDLGTPLATVNGIAKLLLRDPPSASTTATLAGLVDAAALTWHGSSAGSPLQLGSRPGSYQPLHSDADTLKLARPPTHVHHVAGRAPPSDRHRRPLLALEALALATLRHADLAL